MRAISAGFFCAFLLALVATPWVRRLALQVKALDQLSARKVMRTTTVPRLGGLGIAAAFYATIGLLWLAHSTLATGVLSDQPGIAPILLGGVPILLLGSIDDLRGLRALTKLVVQMSVSAALWGIGLRVGGTTSFWLHFDLPAWASLGVTVLWITGVINAVNLIDGLDGLASGVAFFALAATGATAALRGDLTLALFSVTLAGAVLGFLVFNWNPASIFMGDAGSMFLGYLLATTSIWTVQKAATAVALVFPAVALGLPLLDTSLTISRRLLSGRPVMQADRDHVHHRLLSSGYTHQQTVILLYGVCAVFSVLAVGMSVIDGTPGKALLGVAAVFTLGLTYALGYVRGGPHGLWHSLRQRSRNRALLQQLGAMTHQMEHAHSLNDLQDVVHRFAHSLGIGDLRLVLMADPGALGERDGPDAGPSGLRSGSFGKIEVESGAGTSYPICALEGVLGRIVSRRAESTISPDDRVLMQLLCDLLASPLRRLTTRPRTARLPDESPRGSV